MLRPASAARHAARAAAAGTARLGQGRLGLPVVMHFLLAHELLDACSAARVLGCLLILTLTRRSKKSPFTKPGQARRAGKGRA